MLHERVVVDRGGEPHQQQAGANPHDLLPPGVLPGSSVRRAENLDDAQGADDERDNHHAPVDVTGVEVPAHWFSDPPVAAVSPEAGRRERGDAAMSVVVVAGGRLGRSWVPGSRTPVGEGAGGVSGALAPRGTAPGVFGIKLFPSRVFLSTYALKTSRTNAAAKWRCAAPSQRPATQISRC